MFGRDELLARPQSLIGRNGKSALRDLSQQSAFRFQAVVRGLHGCQKQPVVHAVDKGVFVGVEGGGVEIAGPFLMSTQEPEGAGHRVQVVGEVFAPKLVRFSAPARRRGAVHCRCS